MTSEDGRSGCVSKLDGVREIWQPPLRSTPSWFWLDLTVPHRLRFTGRLLRNKCHVRRKSDKFVYDCILIRYYIYVKLSFISYSYVLIKP